MTTHDLRIRRISCLAAATLATTLFCLGNVWADDFRTWTDATGKFQIKAKFVSLKDGKVTLEKEDGKAVEIDVNKLSPADRKAAADAAAAAAPKEDDPFKPKEDPKTAAPAGVAKTITADWSNAKSIELAATQNEWKFTLPNPVTPKLRSAPIAMPAKADIHERMKTTVLNPVCKRMLVGYGKDFPKEKMQTRLVLCDLENGSIVSSVTVPGVVMIPVALHDDGTQAVMRGDGNMPGEKSKLEVWTFDSGSIRKGITWSPYGEEDNWHKDVTWATFIDSKRLVTLNNGGKFAIWDLAAGKPLHYMQIKDGCTPALSPDRKYLAFATGTEIGILDLEIVQVLARLTAPQQLNTPLLSFSTTGKRLACMSINKLFVWEFNTGQLYREIDISTGGAVRWPNDDNVLLVQGRLLDLQSQIPLWDYHGTENAPIFGGYAWCAVSEGVNRKEILVPAKIPHPAVKTALEKAQRDPNFFVIKPGTAVRIDVSGIGDAAKRDQAAAGLTERLKAAGCTVSANSPVELLASTDGGKEREITYTTMGMRFGPRAGGGETFKIREYFSRLEFRSQGQKIWETQWSNIQHFVMLRDETLEQFLKRNDHPNYELFNRIELPKYLSRTGSNALGTSRITAAGLE
jgi:WD40 repeat protein